MGVGTMIFERLCELIAEQFSVDAESITMETSFEETLGADSLDIVELSMALEEEFDIGEIGDEDMSSITTVGDLVRFLQSRLD
jgi:acyl carrier protein